MWRQYHAVKAAHADEVLFFRMGDFYEVFFDDATLASRVLGIALTTRSKGPDAIPMAGVPVASAESYIARLIRAGHRVAICEQVQDPTEARGLVERAVTRIVTPGTLTEERILPDRGHNYLLALAGATGGVHGAAVGSAWADLSTGDFACAELGAGRVEDLLARLRPAEVLLAESLRARPEGSPAWLRGLAGAAHLTWRPDWVFERDAGRARLLAHLGTLTLEGYGCEGLGPGLGAAGAVLHYLEETQRTSLGHIRRLRRVDPEGELVLNRATRRTLELTEGMATGGLAGSLLWALDRTRTAMGGRLLRDWLAAPLTRVEAILRRQEAVAALVEDASRRDEVSACLAEIYDVERILARVATDRANARDLVALRRSLEPLPRLRELAQGLAGPGALELSDVASRLDPCEELREHVGRALVDAPPLTVQEGGLIREGYHAELDELRELGAQAEGWLARYQEREAQRTGIASLKVGFHRVFGYFIEVRDAHRERVPADYRRRQTLKNAERYVTEELASYEDRVLGADRRARRLESELFQGLRRSLAAEVGRLQTTAAAVAELDALVSLAAVAAERGYARPRVDESLDLVIEEGRHPVVELTLEGERFVPNDLRLEDGAGRLVLLTGPNMAGKSTYVRQVALIALMAQVGSFVPARSARVGVADRIYTRLGSADELSRGQSTFMVEMTETAEILNGATERSLVVLDEVGRGTSTYDGLSLAWALTEHLRTRIGCRALFATHYHQLTELAQHDPGVRNFHSAVREWGDRIVFLHEIREGATDRSYGIHVARLAGVPEAVLERARGLLLELEEHGRARPAIDPRCPAATRAGRAERQLDLFRPLEERVLAALRELDPERMTPLAALAALAELRGTLAGSGATLVARGS
ncbi:MAG: DNA mismatch repair protein MutS [Planctomycetes bacterium]|nr:DNA mismatch repair protein MutS [Planctomycetota bacterium]